MGVHRSFRKKKKVWGVGIHHVDQIGQGETIGACFLSVKSKESYALPRTGESKREIGGWVPLRLGDGRYFRSLDGDLSPARVGRWGSNRDAVRVQWVWVLLGPGWRFRRRVRERK